VSLLVAKSALTRTARVKHSEGGVSLAGDLGGLKSRRSARGIAVVSRLSWRARDRDGSARGPSERAGSDFAA
jgi:hypothetical protein